MDIKKIRSEYKMIRDDLIFFDNGAGSLKPNCVVDAICEYYHNDNGNPHSADYEVGKRTVERVDKVRQQIANFINAESKDNIVFTSGTTLGLNMIIKGISHLIKKGDKVCMTHVEHASMILPIYELGNEITWYKPLEYKVETFKDAKIVALIASSNVLGVHYDVEKIIKDIRSVAPNAIVIIDAAQYLPHKKVDVQKWDCDFIVASSHKFYGPTGSGFMYGKDLSIVKPIVVGGGMNVRINVDQTYTEKKTPHNLEPGTINAAGIYGMGAAIEYMERIGIENIHARDVALRKHLLDKLSTVKGITIYDKEIEGSATISFNIEGCHPHDIVYYLGNKGVCLRAGNHCAKLLKEEIGIDYSVRASLCFYNTEEEIDRMVDLLNEAGGDFLDGII